jgi:hypothetical protein
MYWVLDNPDKNDNERGAVDVFFFPDTYIPEPGNKPFLTLRSDGLGTYPAWLWDTIRMFRLKNGVRQESYTWTNDASTWIDGGSRHPEWYHFGFAR